MRVLVADALCSPERHWHGPVHHALMLRAVSRAPDPVERRLLVLATLFHDIVYDARRADNEERSAAVAADWVTGEDAAIVTALILATKHHDLAADAMTRRLLFADLAVLWTPSRRLYAFYAQGIRAEYAHVPAASYRAGRGAVLAQLGKDILGHLTRADAAALEANLCWERSALEAGEFDRA